MTDDELDDEAARAVDLIARYVGGQISLAAVRAAAPSFSIAALRRATGLDDEAERARLGLPPLDKAGLQ